MGRQVTIVLIEGEYLPRDLPGLLVAMGVAIKTTWALGLQDTMERMPVDLVVCSDPTQLPQLQRAIQAAQPATLLLLIADWDLNRLQRTVASGLVDDLIPDSLPAIDIATRLQGLATRHARGVLLKSKSTIPPRVAPSRQTGRPPPRMIAPEEATRLSSLPMPPVRPRVAPATLPPTCRADLQPSGGPHARPVSAAPRPHLGRSATPPYRAPPDSAGPLALSVVQGGDGTPLRRKRSKHKGQPVLTFTAGALVGLGLAMAAAITVVEFGPALRAARPWASAEAFVTSPWPTPSLSAASSAVKHLLLRDGPTMGTLGLEADRSEAATQLAAPPAPLPDKPVELSDLSASETDPQSGLSLVESQRLFQIADSHQPACADILKDWQPTLPLFEEDRPQRAATHRRAGQAHLMVGEQGKALAELCKSAKLDPGGAGAEILAGRYLAQRSLENAELSLKQLLEVDPTRDSARELLGDVQNQRGRVAEARRMWLEVLGVTGDAAGVMKEVAKHWVGDALAAQRASDLAQAERKLRRALTFDPRNVSAALLLSRVLLRQGQPEASLAWAARARAIQ